MYGDCQVLTSMGGNVVSSDSLFSSPIRNPNFNFMSSMGGPFHAFSSIIPVSFSCTYLVCLKKNSSLICTEDMIKQMWFVFCISEGRKWAFERERWDGEWVWKWAYRRSVRQRARERTTTQEKTLPQTHCSPDPRNGSVCYYFSLTLFKNMVLILQSQPITHKCWENHLNSHSSCTTVTHFLQFIQGMPTPRWQAEDETQPRTWPQTTPSQVLVPKPANPDEGAHVSISSFNDTHLSFYPTPFLSLSW